MSQEIRIGITASVSKNTIKIAVGESQVADMAGSAATQDTQLIATAATALTFAESAAPSGFVILKNLDATNYVDLCMDNTFATPFARLYPNTPAGSGNCICYLPAFGSGTYYAKANTASCRILKWAV